MSEATTSGRWSRSLLQAAAAVWLLVALAPAQAIQVAAAADLNPVLTRLAEDYRKQTGREVKISFGASGALSTQIENGAPFDLFFSADESYPRQLMEAGLADSGTLYRYATGRLVLWTPAGSRLDVEHRGYQALLDPAAAKIAIANPQHAPYGRAAEAALRYWAIYEKVAGKLVLGENISQAAQFVESGNAQIGLVALSHVLAPAMQGKGAYWLVPQDAFPPLNQAAVVLTHSEHKTAAAAFLQYIKQPAPAELLKRYGFATPDSAPSEAKP
jgi:molybdate transport system substrate-binding protein